MRKRFLALVVAAACTGCAANCVDLQQQLDSCQKTMTDQDFIIKKQDSMLRQKDHQIKTQEEGIESLQSKITELGRRLNISAKEKGRSTERIKNIASAVREYLKKQMQENRNFLTDVALDDFIGNELVARGNSGGEGMFIIDTANPIPSGGQINGIGGYFLGPADITVKLLRPVGMDYIVTYNQQIHVDADSPGTKTIDFDKPLIVKKDDLLAYYFPKNVNVPWDNNIGIKTYFPMPSDNYGQGSRITAGDIWRKDQDSRKYSLNYYGVFYTRFEPSDYNVMDIVREKQKSGGE